MEKDERTAKCVVNNTNAIRACFIFPKISSIRKPKNE